MDFWWLGYYSISILPAEGTLMGTWASGSVLHDISMGILKMPDYREYMLTSLRRLGRR